ncbi:Predicted L-lactate dehydrogenase, Fe-S oxidoreductase subunit YkgE [hydrothermal vent metagenome]|uniref:Predicted L-lactate dehydrogenase, Fe-S oxidoreductase subunit YkgE n=1 Tax=hydrothermal vent metagenome TaxID=652676 RepID=A0A1W1BE25_9ZZZZ
MQKIALFVPCFVDAIYPRVAVATLKILKDLGFDVIYPQDQTCCGQPLYNSGFKKEAQELAKKFYDDFNGYDYIVAPSGSCISMVKHHYKELLPPKKFEDIRSKAFEICEFLHDIVQVKSLSSNFKGSIALHQSCHGLRELELASANELNIPYFNKVLHLLNLVEGVEIKDLKNAQECCGFGGTFSLNESDLSIAMGKDKLANFRASKADYLVGYDNSCLMHLASIDPTVKILHVVEILAGVSDETF